jgi:hypothetical protein
MADDRAKREWRSRVNLGEEFEVEYWTRKLNVSPQDLRLAVEKVGNSAKAVENELFG